MGLSKVVCDDQTITKQYSVLLLDEIEKRIRMAFNILLQVISWHADRQ
jgi:ATP-dependent Clp protease ATP-binding subunit ClpA